MEDAKRQGEAAVNRAQAWADKDADLVNLLPEQGLCLLCHLGGKAEQPKHDLIFLCPHPSALIIPYAWSNGRLRAGARFMADKSCFVDVIKAIVDRYAGEHPDTTGRWIRLHGAAQDLLEACRAAVALLTGQAGNEEEVLALLRDAIAQAKG